MSRARVLAFLLAGSLALAATPAIGFHTNFHFHVDRFEADGNVFGPADGVPDFVDDFEGTSLVDWFPLYGTSSVSEGMLHLQNPGEHFGVGFPVDVSEVISNAVFGMAAGAATLTSHWLPPSMTPGSSLHMTLALVGPSQHWQYVGMHVANSPEGPGIGLHTITRVGNTWTPIQYQGIPFDPAVLTDRLVLRLVVSTGQVAGSFSLDGGETFQNPFAPFAVMPSMQSGQIMLGADPQTTMEGTCGNLIVDPGESCDLGLIQNGKGTCCTETCTLVDADGDGACDPKDVCPATADPAQQDRDGDGLGDACDPCTTTVDGQRQWGRALVALGHLNDHRPGNESLRMAGVFGLPPDAPALDPIATGARLVLRSAKDGGTVTIALPGGEYVAPGPGWQADPTGTRFVFVDRRPGGTQGVRKMAVRRLADGRVRLTLAAPRGSFELGAWSFPPVHAAVSFGETSDACAEIRFAERACAYPASRRIVCR